jgi:hypothetical protein
VVEQIRTDYGDNAGLLYVADIESLPADLDISRDLVLAQPGSFIDDGGDIVGAWPSLRLVAERLAPRFADRLLAAIDKRSCRVPPLRRPRQMVEVRTW